MSPRTTTTIRPEEWTFGARPDQPSRILLMLRAGQAVHAVDVTLGQAEELGTALLLEVARRRQMS